jgi:hypothetical protein
LERSLRQTESDRRASLARARRFVPVVVIALGLCSCAEISQKFAATASQLPGIGLSPDAPERPATPLAYPAVHDMPAPRNSVMLTDIEQQKLEDDLTVARDRQQTSVGLPVEKKTKAKQQGPARPIPAASSRSIY